MMIFGVFSALSPTVDTLRTRRDGSQSRRNVRDDIMTELSLGDSVPDVTLPTASGEGLRLADFRGEWLLLVFHRHLM